MRKFYYDFQIDKQPVLVPDADLQIEYCDLDSENSGRDECGFMHRIVLRRKMKVWSVAYAVLTAEEYRYMESLFAEKDKFLVEYRDHNGMAGSCMAYRSTHGITVHNAKKGIYKNYKFNIIEC